MSTLAVIATVLYTMVVLTLIGNFIRLFVDSRKLKAEGKTPLVGQTATIIVVAAVAEAIVLFLLLKVFISVSGLVGVIITFVILYYIRQITAYLSTWGAWSLFVRQAKKKEIEKIQQEVNKGTGK